MTATCGPLTEQLLLAAYHPLADWAGRATQGPPWPVIQIYAHDPPPPPQVIRSTQNQDRYAQSLANITGDILMQLRIKHDSCRLRKTCRLAPASALPLAHLSLSQIPNDSPSSTRAIHLGMSRFRAAACGTARSYSGLFAELTMNEPVPRGSHSQRPRHRKAPS